MAAKEFSSRPVAEGLYEKSFARVLKLMRRKRLRGADVDDVMQEAYQRLLRARDFEGVSDPQRYLVGIAHCALMERRKRQQHLRFAAAFVDGPDDSESALEINAERMRLLAILNALPEQLRIPFVLSRRGMSHADIARSLGLSVSTIRNRLARALVAFARELELHTNDDRSGT